MKKIVKPHKVRRAPSSTGLAQYKGGKDKYQYPYESQLNVPVKVSGNKYNLSPRQLAGISDEYSSLVYDPKQYVEDFKMFGPDIFIDKDVERANEMLDNGYGFFEMSPLQEVVVTPDYDLMRKAQQIVPNKSLRTALYQLAEDYTKKHSSNYGVNRLLDLYQYAGKPSVQEVNTGIYSIIPSKFPNGKSRAFYNPSFDTMYLGRNQETLHQYGDSYNPSDLAAELAHPYHLKVSNKSPLRAITDAIFRGRADKKVNGKTAYQRHGDVEYQTHQIVQPEMRYYVDSEESLDNFNKRLQKQLKDDNKYDKGKDQIQNDGKDKNKSVVYYDSSTGEYSSDLSPKLSIVNRIGDDPTQWTYTDDKGRLYTPTQTQVNSGEITQGKNPSIMDRFLNWSEQHYNNPILGAPARYAYTIKNNQDPITGVVSFMPGIGEAIDLGSATVDALSGNYGSAIVGGAASLLPFVPYNKVRKLYNRLSKSFGHNTAQDVSDTIGDITNQTKYTPNDENIYQAYLDSDDFKYDARTYNNLADNGFFGPDYYGYINDYNGIYDENKQVHNAIESAMNNPNITEDQVSDLINQYSVASYPFYPPYPFAESSEILNSYERARNAKQNLNNNYSIRNLFQLRENVHDNNTIQQMRDLVQYYRNAEQSGEPLQQMLTPSLFVHNINNPEFISLRDELYRYQDLARSQERERFRQQFEQIPKPTNSTQVEENSLTDKQIANSLMRNEPYDPNNLPEEFISATSDVSDRTGAAYFYDDPKRALREARNDFELLQHGQAWNLNHHGAVSTDSYPLMLAMFRRHQKDGLIKPIKDKDGNIKFMRLNSFGKHKGEDAVKRINKTINDLSETIGEQLPEAQVDNGNIYVPQVLFRKYDRGKNKSVIQNTIAYNQWRSTLPKNLQTETPDYDLYGAFKAGLQPEWNDEDKSYHLGSRDPKTGKILKKPSHPTFGQAIYNDMLLGYYPIYKDGDIYTVNPFEYNSGKDSGIHIKKKNRGKFTAAAKRAGMGVQAYARKILSAPKGKYSATLRKRANFARNASKFKH